MALVLTDVFSCFITANRNFAFFHTFHSSVPAHPSHIESFPLRIFPIAWDLFESTAGINYLDK